MLARENRVPRADFKRLLKKSKPRGSVYFVVYAFPSPLSRLRASCVVSTKVFRSAVQRNHLRRQLYEIVRLQYATLPAGQDLIILARPQAARASYDQLSTDLTHHLRKLLLTPTV